MNNKILYKIITVFMIIILWITLTNAILLPDYNDFIMHNILFKNVSIGDRILSNIDYFYLLKIEYDKLLVVSNIQKDYFIMFIYISLFLIFILHISLLFFKKYKDSIIAFNLNSAPMLGIMGTLYAFMITVSNSHVKAEGMIEIFKANFGIAATTTLLGGATYIICLLLNIVIENEV